MMNLFNWELSVLILVLAISVHSLFHYIAAVVLYAIDEKSSYRENISWTFKLIKSNL